MLFFSGLLLLSFFSAAFPKLAANFFDGLGAGGLAVSLTENVYKRTGDINDAALLTERAIKYGDSERVALYAPRLTGLEAYDGFAAWKNGQGVAEISDYKSYINGNYLIALYRTGDLEKCSALCLGFTAAVYTETNPAGFLVRYLYQSGGAFDPLSAMLEEKFRALETAYKLSPENAIRGQLRLLALDLYQLHSGEAIGAEFWRREFDKYK
jgi:hypothetical protein